LLLVGLVALLVGGLCYTFLPWVGLTQNIATFFLELSLLGLLQMGLAMTLGLMVLAAGALWGERYLYS